MVGPGFRPIGSERDPGWDVRGDDPAGDLTRLPPTPAGLGWWLLRYGPGFGLGSLIPFRQVQEAQLRFGPLIALWRRVRERDGADWLRRRLYTVQVAGNAVGPLFDAVWAWEPKRRRWVWKPRPERYTVTRNLLEPRSRPAVPLTTGPDGPEETLLDFFGQTAGLLRLIRLSGDRDPEKWLARLRPEDAVRASRPGPAWRVHLRLRIKGLAGLPADQAVGLTLWVLLRDLGVPAGEMRPAVGGRGLEFRLEPAGVGEPADLFGQLLGREIVQSYPSPAPRTCKLKDCGRPIPPERRADAEYCSRECAQRAAAREYRARQRMGRMG
jgi:hypothetical protein